MSNSKQVQRVRGISFSSHQPSDIVKAPEERTAFDHDKNKERRILFVHNPRQLDLTPPLESLDGVISTNDVRISPKIEDIYITIPNQWDVGDLVEEVLVGLAYEDCRIKDLGG